jgi:hypothetical protein
VGAWALLSAAVLAAAAPVAAADDEVLRYEAGLDADSGLLDVVAHIPEGCSDEVSLDREVAGYVARPERLLAGVWTPAARKGNHVLLPGCEEEGCTLRYRFELRRAAQSLSDFESITAHEGNLLGSPSNWLLTPTEWPHSMRYRLQVHAPAGWTFVSGVQAAADRTPDVYEGEVGSLTEGPFSGFGRFDREHLHIGGSDIDVALSGKPADRAAVIRWVRRAAEAVSGYYGTFPVARVAILVLTEGGRGVSFGAAMGNGGASVIIWVGRDSTAADLDDDWTLTHEMTHLALPRIGRSRHAWLVEGLATYIEPMARARAAQEPEVDVWDSLVENLPKGEPGLFDRGLDVTHSWGRTYWGGALFCFVADLRIREQTHNAKGLRDAMRGVVTAGGTIADDWSIDRVFETADRATGTRVLEDLYAENAEHAVDIELAPLFAKLGVTRSGSHTEISEGAPEAPIRRAMTGAGAPAPSPAR